MPTLNRIDPAWPMAAAATALLWAVALPGCSAPSTPAVDAAGARHQATSTDVGTVAPTGDLPGKQAPASGVNAPGVGQPAASRPSVKPVVGADIAVLPEPTGNAPEKIPEAITEQVVALDADNASAERRVELADATPEVAVVAAAPLPPSALPAEDAPSFAFGEDAPGRWIAKFFAVPAAIDPGYAESDRQELAWSRSFERLPGDLLPSAERAGPCVLPLEQIALNPFRPVIDLPPLGVEAEIMRPERPALPLAPRTAQAGSDPQTHPALPALGKMNVAAASLSDDATSEFLLRSLLTPLGSLRSAGIRFVPPPPIDPYAHAHELDLKDTPADNDPPARPTAALPAPALP